MAETSTISWGQGCGNGELGHGADKPRSATNAVLVDSLEGFHIQDVSCGYGHTLLLVDRKDPKFEKLPIGLEHFTEAPVASVKKTTKKAVGAAPTKTATKRKANDNAAEVPATKK